MEPQDQKFKELGLDKQAIRSGSDAPHVCSYIKNLDKISDKNPVLVLVHGYPQSSYMWRLLIPLLPKEAPLFVPDLPGYGQSPALQTHTKQAIGGAIISALSSQVNSPNPIPAILIGHDRGARIVHRLAVPPSPDIKLLGICLIDIVPTTTQWDAFKKAPAACGSFHWPFLANVSLATAMIQAYGGGKWCKDMILRWAGKNEEGLKRLESERSLEVYGSFFEKEEVIKASCQDYEAGAYADVEAQIADQEKGGKIEIPVLLLYGKDFIGSRFDMKKEWEDWVKPGVEITDGGVGGGIGHFVPEEDPESTWKALEAWKETLEY